MAASAGASRTVILFGGPEDGHKVTIAAGLLTYECMALDYPSLGKFHSQGIPPMVDSKVHRYTLVEHVESGRWFGIHQSISRPDYPEAVSAALIRLGHPPEYHRPIIRIPGAHASGASEYVTGAVTKSGPSSGREPYMLDDAALRTVITGMTWDVIRMDTVRGRSAGKPAGQDPAKEYVLDDGSVFDGTGPLKKLTITTRKPDKWRFIDTETGETWRWDENMNQFVKVVYNHD